jgi:hypothetical protein
LAVGCLATLALAGPAHAGTFSPAAPISDGAAPAQSAAIDANASGAAASVWLQGGTIQAASLAAGASAWSAPQVLATLGAPISRPSVAIDAAGDAIAVWTAREGEASYVRASLLSAGTTTWAPAFTLETGEPFTCRTPHTKICSFGVVVDASVDASPSGRATVAWSVGEQLAPRPHDRTSFAEVRSADVDLATGAVSPTMVLDHVQMGVLFDFGHGQPPRSRVMQRDIHVAADDAGSAVSWLEFSTIYYRPRVLLASRASAGAWATRGVFAGTRDGGLCCSSLVIDPNGAATVLFSAFARRLGSRFANAGQSLVATAPTPGVLVGPERVSTPHLVVGPLSRGVLAQSPDGRQTLFLSDQSGPHARHVRSIVARTRASALAPFGPPQLVLAGTPTVPFGAAQLSSGEAVALLASPLAPTSPDSTPGVSSVDGSVLAGSWQQSSLDPTSSTPRLAQAGDAGAVAAWLTASARVVGSRFAPGP